MSEPPRPNDYPFSFQPFLDHGLPPDDIVFARGTRVRVNGSAVIPTEEEFLAMVAQPYFPPPSRYRFKGFLVGAEEELILGQDNGHVDSSQERFDRIFGECQAEGGYDRLLRGGESSAEATVHQIELAGRPVRPDEIRRDVADRQGWRRAIEADHAVRLLPMAAMVLYPSDRRGRRHIFPNKARDFYVQEVPRRNPGLDHEAVALNSFQVHLSFAEHTGMSWTPNEVLSVCAGFTGVTGYLGAKYAGSPFLDRKYTGRASARMRNFFGLPVVDFMDYDEYLNEAHEHDFKQYWEQRALDLYDSGWIHHPPVDHFRNLPLIPATDTKGTPNPGAGRPQTDAVDDALVLWYSNQVWKRQGVNYAPARPTRLGTVEVRPMDQQVFAWRQELAEYDVLGLGASIWRTRRYGTPAALKNIGPIKSMRAHQQRRGWQQAADHGLYPPGKQFLHPSTHTQAPVEKVENDMTALAYYEIAQINPAIGERYLQLEELSRTIGPDFLLYRQEFEMVHEALKNAGVPSSNYSSDRLITDNRAEMSDLESSVLHLWSWHMSPTAPNLESIKVAHEQFHEWVFQHLQETGHPALGGMDVTTIQVGEWEPHPLVESREHRIDLSNIGVSVSMGDTATQATLGRQI